MDSDGSREEWLQNSSSNLDEHRSETRISERQTPGFQSQVTPFLIYIENTADYKVVHVIRFELIELKFEHGSNVLI